MDISAMTRRIDAARRAADQLDGVIQNLETVREDSRAGVINSWFRAPRERMLRERVGAAASQAEDGVRILRDAGVDPDGIKHLGYAVGELRRIEAAPDIQGALSDRLNPAFWGNRSTLTNELRAIRADVRIVPLTNPVVESTYELGTTLRALAEQTLAKSDAELTYDDLVHLDQLAALDKTGRLGMNMPGANAPVRQMHRHLLVDTREQVTDGLVSRWHSVPGSVRGVPDRRPENTPAIVEHLAELRSWATRSRQLEDAFEGRGDVPTNLRSTDLPFLLGRLDHADPALRQQAMDRVGPAHEVASERELLELGEQAELDFRQRAEGVRTPYIFAARVSLLEATRTLSALDADIAPELRPLVESTRSLIDLNEARLAYRIHDGWLNHPKYEEIGRIRSNIELIEAVSRIRATAASATDETLTW